MFPLSVPLLEMLAKSMLSFNDTALHEPDPTEAAKVRLPTDPPFRPISRGAPQMLPPLTVTGSTIVIFFCCTPETEAVTRVYKLLARDDLGGDPERLRAFVAAEDTILAEDLAILERYNHRGVPVDRTVEVHTRADRLSLGWRSLLAELTQAPPNSAVTRRRNRSTSTPRAMRQGT